MLKPLNWLETQSFTEDVFPVEVKLHLMLGIVYDLKFLLRNKLEKKYTTRCDFIVQGKKFN